MKKYLFLLFAFISCFAFSQPVTSFTLPTGSVDSSTVKYATTSIGGGGTLWIKCDVTKLPNSGTTLAGRVTLQMSDGTSAYVPCSTDTFTLANVTTIQSHSWLVNNLLTSGLNHPAYTYRLVFTQVTSKLTVNSCKYVRR
jgi:hypothetical protein